MQPIRRSLLPNTVTIYNKFRDPDTGKNAFYRTFLRYVRIMENVTKAVVDGTTTVTWANDTVLLLDHGLTVRGVKYSTEAYTRDENGRKIAKRYLAPREWAVAEDKSGFWTLERENYVIEGECAVTIPPQLEKDLTALNPWKVTALAPAIQKDGSIHSWEVQLV